LEAAELLGVGERTFRRWRQRYDEDGEAGLLDRRLGKAPGKRVPVDREAEVESLYRSRYNGFTAKHFHELLLRDHKFTWVIPGRKRSCTRRACRTKAEAADI
jgi:transposase